MIKILLVDDHKLVREGIKNLLESDKKYSVIAETTNVNDSLEVLKKLEVDLLITDISLENSDGIYLTKQVRGLFPDLHILVLSMHNSIDYINESLKSGANGYLLKDCTRFELFDAISRIRNNERYVCKEVGQILMNDSLNNQNKENAEAEKNNFKALSVREIEILNLIHDGLINKEIANRLALSVRTVDKHRSNILQKFQVNNTPELLRKAKQFKLLND